MRVLCHGAPFCCDYALLDTYRGNHDIRWIGIDPRARYRFDPLNDSANAVLDRIRQEWRPDLMLCWTPEIYPPPLDIEKIDLPTAALVSDWHLHYPTLETNLARFDVVLCDKPGVRILRTPNVNVHHVTPLYSQITAIHYPHNVPRDIDILYLGSLNSAAHPHRARLLHRLALLSDQYRVGIGSGIVQEAYAHLLSRARIVFNHTVRGELNLRVFEALACGATLFLEAKNEEVRDWLSDGVDVVLYTEDNLEEKIKQVLTQTELCDAIAQRGQEHSVGFAGENRLDSLIEWIAQQPRGVRAFNDLSPIERQYQDLLLYGFSRWESYVPLRKTLASALVQSQPEDPRFWTLLGRTLLPGPGTNDTSEAPALCMKAFGQAHRLHKESGPYALNAATIARSFGMDDWESICLQEALSSTTLKGSSLLLGNPACPFWNRWMRAVAERTTTLKVLHAEARIRFATLLARHGQAETAMEHLLVAREEDPGNYSGIRLQSEILWAMKHQAEAAQLMNVHANCFPLDMDYHERLIAMHDALGNETEAQGCREEIRRLQQALDLPRTLLG